MKRNVAACLLVICLLLACAGPTAFAETAQKALAFTALTLDGKEITSRELFHGHQITVINVWATWCEPCVDELAELSKLHSRLQKLGCGVVGVLWDGGTALEKGQAIAEEKSVNYPIVLPCKGMDALTEITVFPTTFFVDFEGRFIGEAITGAKVEEYEKAVQSLLRKNEEWEGAPAGASDQPDENGNSGVDPADDPVTVSPDTPVPDGMILVCDGDSCVLIPLDNTSYTEPEPQTQPEESYPACPIIIEYISETEIVAHAAGEYTGMDDSVSG